VSKLTAWAQAYPPGARSAVASGLQHTPEERAKVQKEKMDHKMKAAKSKKADYCEENGHAYIAAIGTCRNCGAPDPAAHFE
jgi:hypothetical protein